MTASEFWFERAITRAAERDRLREVNAELLAALQIAAIALKDHCQYDDGESLERTAYDAAIAVIARAEGKGA